MDDDDEGPRGRQQQDAAPTGPAMGPIYIMWENTLEKLKILNYESGFCAAKDRKPLNRVHFALPGANLSHQFDDFVEICGWLCTEITGERDFFKRDSFDDPNTVANKLMLALRQLEFKGAFPSQKLKTAHGEPVCLVLEFLADKALDKRGFKWGAPVYTESDEIEQAAVDEENDDEIEDDALGGAEEDVLFEEVASTEIAEVSLDSSAHHILQADVDPIAWKTELERVGPKLRAQQQLATNEWRSHVDQTVLNKSKIKEVLDREGAQRELENMKVNIGDDLNKMRTKEKYLNNQYSTVCKDYEEIKKKLEDLQKKGSSTNEVVTKLTNELAEVTEKLDELKESFESKDSGINDTSPLVRMKTALQQIKSEIQAYDLRIGVVSHTLLSSRVSANRHRRQGLAQKAKQRRKTSGKKQQEEGEGANDDNSIISDD